MPAVPAIIVIGTKYGCVPTTFIYARWIRTPLAALVFVNRTFPETVIVLSRSM